MGGAPVAEQVAAIMGQEVGESTRMVAFVKCAGTCERTEQDYHYHGIEDCKMMAFVPAGGPKSCNHGCIGYGSCVKACQFDAIHIVDGIALVDKEACKACGKCVSECPKNLIELVPVLCADKAEQLQAIIATFGIDARIVVRKKYYVVYIKEGSQIVDILNVMEAPVALMELENIRILKEMRGSVNRQVNCETANINKTVSAAVKQMEDIIYIRDTAGFDSLPDNLREIAELRLARPEATLKELGEALDPPVGKSGVNHRLRKLGSMAELLRQERPDTGV